MVKKNKPEIRFKGFTDDWEQRKLGEVAKYRNGKAHENCIDDNGKYIVVNSKFVSTDGKVKKFSNMQNEELFENEIAFVLSDVPNGRAIARTFLIEKSDKYTLNQRIAGITPLNESYPYFLYILMNRHPYFLAFDDGAKQTNLSVSDVMEFEAYYPQYNEQQKIGEYFKKLDNLITLHQRKCEKLKNMKKAMLEKLFPKNGSNIPEVRFRGFTDDWEQRKLGELCDVYDGTHQTPSYKDSGIMFLSVENIKTLRSEKYISEEDFKRDFSIYPEKYDVLMTRIGDIGTANIVESNEPKAYYVSLALLKKKFLDPYFLKESIASEVVKKELWQRTLHIAFPKKINKNEITQITVPYPISKEEQQQIGIFFKYLNNLITLHQRQLEKLKNVKKSMLEKMFV